MLEEEFEEGGCLAGYDKNEVSQIITWIYYDCDHDMMIVIDKMNMICYIDY